MGTHKRQMAEKSGRPLTGEAQPLLARKRARGPSSCSVLVGGVKERDGAPMWGPLLPGVADLLGKEGGHPER